MDSYGIFIKFLKSEHIPDLIAGKLYMKNLQYYIDLENKTGIAGQGDKLEGKIPISTKIITAPPFETKITLHKSYGYEKYPVFCMVHLEPFCTDGYTGSFAFKNQKQYAEMKNFTEDCVVITNIDEFIIRFNNACKKEKILGCHEQVFYDKNQYQSSKVLQIIEDNNLHSCFYKNENFALQQEYRFLLCKEVEDKFVLDISNIEDITKVCKTEDFNRRP